MSPLTHFHFPLPNKVGGLASIADLYPEGKRRGIYILSFADGEMYVGRTDDITRRFDQHRKVYNDIVGLTLKRVAKHDLGEAARSVIHSLQREGRVIRNVTFSSSIPPGETRFDRVMLPEEQARWLEDTSYVDGTGARAEHYDDNDGNHDALRHTTRFEQFIRMPQAAKVIKVLKRYVEVGLPAFRRSEIDFWECSCLPGWSGQTSGEGVVYSRVNVNRQEVITISDGGLDGRSGPLQVSLYVARSAIEAVFGSLGGQLVEIHPTARVVDPQYEPAGGDQVALAIEGADAAVDLLKDPDIVQAIRLFNLRHMRKGSGAGGKYHCADLADRLLGS